MSPKSSSFVLLCCTFNIILHNAGGILYHIKPSSYSPCAQHNCLTLSQFASQSNTSDLNTTAVFLPGNHNLSTSLVITDVHHFRINGDDSIQEDQATSIICDSSGNIQISRATSVSIVGMHFYGCGSTIIDDARHFMLKSSTFHGNVNSETALVIKAVKNASIIKSHFIENTNGRHHIVVDSFFTIIRAGGAISVSRSILEITESTFKGNEAEIGGVIYSESDTTIVINKSNATSNKALSGGSVLYLNTGCNAIITASNFSTNNGSVLAVRDSMLLIDSSVFSHNQGGVIKKSFQGYLSDQETFSVITLNQSQFFNNEAINGGVINTFAANITIENSTFTSNEASKDGGVIFTQNCSINIINSVFNNNSAKEGGVTVSQVIVFEARSKSPVFKIVISNCTFQHNWAGRGGASSVMSSTSMNVHISFSLFQNNSVSSSGLVATITAGVQPIETTISNSVFRYHKGGILYLVGNDYFINNCTFEFNTGGYGVIFMIYGSMTVSQSIFQSNYRTTNIYAWYTDVILFGNNTFRDSIVPYSGGVIFIRGGSITTTGTLKVMNNTAKSSGVIVIDSKVLLSGTVTFENNNGSFYAYSSNVTFLGSIAFVNQQENSIDITSSALPGFERTGLQVGGSITGVYSNLNFHGSVILARNSAANGGAILAIESLVMFNPDSTVSITNNTATDNGGGISLYRCFLTILGNCTLEGNRALMKGGGIYAVSSSITVASSAASPTHFLALNSNTANRGGGMYFEANSQLSILKSTDTDINTRINLNVTLDDNVAEFGGGFFIGDETNTGICNSVVSNTQSLGSECFIQEIDTFEDEQTQVLFMSNNTAISGSNIYGGLLDRCTVSTAASLRVTDIQDGAIETKDIKNGISLLRDFGNLTDIDTLASDPVRVCFCLNHKPDCNDKHPTVDIKRGGSFLVSVVAVDHVNHSVQATIISRVFSLVGDLGEGQRFQTTNTNCTDLRFSVYSSAASEQLVLYAEGPCGDALPSQTKIDVLFLPCECPIGFEPLSHIQETRCECICSSSLSGRISNCNASTGFVMKTNNSWIDYTNATNPPGFISHPYCPYDYCLPVSSQSDGVFINFNNGEEGTNEQCNYNRASTLCGACRQNFSLSLGSSRCLQCPSHWPALTVVILLSILLGGLLLIVLLFVLNISVAIGTINGLIFYANMIAANKTIFFPRVSFPSVFISWFNLEFGFDVCFFDGMDTHSKAWVELVLPTYIIIIVIAIILLSKYSQKFSDLIGKRNPVAILATLILLSYAKYLQAIIVAFSATVLNYPDGSHKLLWLPDATVEYFAGSRIPLFFTAIGILIIGLAYTLILFSWQWIIRYSKLKIVRNPKIRSFMEAYTAPYNYRHRYWTGLLLFARVLLYLTSASNVQDDPQVPLIATIVIAGGLLLLKGLLSGRVYRQWSIDILETILYFNLLFLSLIASRNIEKNESEEIITYFCVVSAFLMFLGVVMYHLYVYIIQQCVRKRELINVFNITRHSRESTHKHPSTSDDDRFHDVVHIFESPSTADYRNDHPSLELQAKPPTISTVDPPK